MSNEFHKYLNIAKQSLAHYRIEGRDFVQVINDMIAAEGADRVLENIIIGWEMRYEWHEDFPKSAPRNEEKGYSRAEP